MTRVVGELRKIHTQQPGILAEEIDAARIAAIIHHFDARAISADAYRRICHDNPALGAIA
jgi:hypothetical protein